MGRELLYRCRLLVCACAAAVGGVLGTEGHIFSVWLAAAAAVLLIPACMARKRGRTFRLAVVALLFLAAGYWLGYARSSRWQGREGSAGEVSLVGSVEVGVRGEPGKETLLFRVTGIDEGDIARVGDVYLLDREGADRPEAQWGDELAVSGSLYIFEDAKGRTGGCLHAGEIRSLSRSRNPLLRLALAFRRELRELIKSYLDADLSGLVEGMVLGDYRRLPAGDIRNLRSSGLMHLCAASGLHVGIMAALAIWLGRRLLLSRRFTLLLQLPILAAYALAAGMSVPVIRASSVAVVAVAAFFLGRDLDFLAAIGTAMLFLLLVDPASASTVSYRLSFAAALGVVLLYRPISSMLPGRPGRLKSLLAATLAAQLSVAPILLHAFGEASLLSVPANLVVLPLVPVVMALALTSTLMGMLGLPMAFIPMKAAAPLAEVILVVARGTAAARWSCLRIYPFCAAWMGVYYPAMAAAALAPSAWRRAGRCVLALLLSAALLAGMGLPLPHLGREDGARITFIDVGQGDATLIEGGSGETVLVDGGEYEERLERELRSRGIAYIDIVVVSHPESDHVGGLEGALDSCGVGLVLHPGVEGVSGEAFFEKAAELGIETRTMRAGDGVELGGLEMEARAPPVDIPENTPTNDCSLVLRVEGPGFSLLLTGDVEEVGELNLLKQPSGLRSDILKVPHHGGYSDLNQELFSAVDPAVAVICVGVDNAYGHPASATLDSLRRAGCSVYRTDLGGDIVIHVMEGGYRVESER